MRRLVIHFLSLSLSLFLPVFTQAALPSFDSQTLRLYLPVVRTTDVQDTSPQYWSVVLHYNQDKLELLSVSQAKTTAQATDTDVSFNPQTLTIDIPRLRFQSVDYQLKLVFDTAKNGFVISDIQEITFDDSEPKPIYLYLFTHTEDHINHELSEERYIRYAPVIDELNTQYPEINLVWTIEFMGADAKTIYDRNDSTGVVDMLRSYADKNVIEFGYHAHHDPNYNNRPQLDINERSSWADKVNAMDEWVSCEKDPLAGGCVQPNMGGLLAIENYFGPVAVVSGNYLYTEEAIEHDAGVHAVRKYLPDRKLGFGFPNHGSTIENDNYAELTYELFKTLTPDHDTSGSLFWMENTLRINDGDLYLQEDNINTLKISAEQVENFMQAYNRQYPKVLNVGLASKYVYTQSSTSPTKWAYANPQTPELPDSLLLSQQQIEKNYQGSIAMMKALAKYTSEQDSVSFISSQQLVDKVAPADYWEISAVELAAMSDDLLSNWHERPPAFVYDGGYYYSLRDMVVLLSKALAESVATTGGSIQLTDSYGPFAQKGYDKAIQLAGDDIRETAKNIARDLQSAEQGWQVEPANLLRSVYFVAGKQIALVQLLYAMASVYQSDYYQLSQTDIDVPGMSSAVPQTDEILKSMGCDDCQGSSWSLKPAKIPAIEN